MAVRIGLPDVSPLYFLAVRFTLAAAIMWAVVLIVRVEWTGVRAIWWHYAIAGVLMNALYLGGAYLAMARISSATMALIGALHPLATALLSRLWLGERFSPLQWAGFGLGITGVALVVGLNLEDLDQRAGMLWGAAGVACLVIGTLHYSRYCKGGGVAPANTVQLTGAAVVTALMAGLFEDVRAEWTASALACLGFLTGAVSLGGFALLLWMLRHGTAGRVAANFYLTPGLTAVLGWLVLGESLTAMQVAGFVVASAGVFLVQRSNPG